MTRAAAIFGLGALFLWISPRLRGQLYEALGGGVAKMDFYAPYSYIAGGLLVLVTLLVSFSRGARAR